MNNVLRPCHHRCKNGICILTIFVTYMYFLRLFLDNFISSATDMKVKWRAEEILKADDPHLIHIIRQKYLNAPSVKPYNLRLDRNDSTSQIYNQYRENFESFVRCQEILERIFSKSSKGFFVESGAMDGEFISNTLFLERSLGWKGLLIEPDPQMYESMKTKNRASWISNSCISPYKYPMLSSFVAYTTSEETNILGRMLTRSTSNLEGVEPPARGLMGKKEAPIKVQCFPLVSYLLALNQTKIDYISLDVEGAEAGILIAFPWDKISVDVWSIEHRILNDHFKEHMESAGRREELMIDSSKLNIKDVRNFIKPMNDTENGKKVVHKVKVVYTNVRDQSAGRDDYMVNFMSEKGYEMVDYWDGDYTFVKKHSQLLYNLKNSEKNYIPKEI